tara:strand:+ start:77552 stop:78382 length:831 start_codon:yes stop_codon:yes gene_type:complete
MLAEGPQAQEEQAQKEQTKSEHPVEGNKTAEDEPAPTPIYEMNDIIRVMMGMHKHLLEYFNPEGSFHQFLLRRDGDNSIGFVFAHRLSEYIPHVKIATTDIKTIRDLYIDALEQMPSSQGFSMLQYLRRTNRNLYGFLKLNMHILDMLYQEYRYDRQRRAYLNRLERQLYHERIAQESRLAEQTKLMAQAPELDDMAPPDDWLLTPEDFLSRPEDQPSCCFSQALNAICHVFSSLKIGCQNGADDEHGYVSLDELEASRDTDHGLMQREQKLEARL